MPSEKETKKEKTKSKIIGQKIKKNQLKKENQKNDQPRITRQKFNAYMLLNTFI